MAAKRVRVGFIGQGYVGKPYADNFEARGYDVVRYGLEEPYRKNKDGIRECDVVFIAVPTPTTPKGFDIAIVRSSLSLIGKGNIAVIKSTIIPGSTKALQKHFRDITILFSPEFLSVATAKEETDHPFCNIVGMPAKTKKHKDAAELIHSILPKAPFSLICTSEEAEIIKYTHNMSAFMQIMMINALYDVAREVGADWKVIDRAIKANPMISTRYSNPIHKKGRGAGGGCFIKDSAAFSQLYRSMVKNGPGAALLSAAEEENIRLLISSKKDEDILEGVYGKQRIERAKKRAA